jgi:hypothetical protein
MDRSELDGMEARVREAVAEVEAYCSATELDSKLHMLTHMTDGIRNLGESSAGFSQSGAFIV